MKKAFAGLRVLPACGAPGRRRRLTTIDNAPEGPRIGPYRPHPTSNHGNYAE